jgi:hypothetical protein
VTSTSFPRTGPRIASPAATPGGPSGPAVVAHRGASAVTPENTLAALHEAVRRGADAVEFDVRRSRDGALVLCHDHTLERTTDARRVLPDRAPWRIGDLTLDELRRVDAGGWHGPSYAGEKIPTLAEALELLRPTGAVALVELKSPSNHPATVPDLVEVLTRSRLVPDRSSCSPSTRGRCSSCGSGCLPCAPGCCCAAPPGRGSARSRAGRTWSTCTISGWVPARWARPVSTGWRASRGR